MRSKFVEPLRLALESQLRLIPDTSIFDDGGVWQVESSNTLRTYDPVGMVRNSNALSAPTGKQYLDLLVRFIRSQQLVLTDFAKSNER